MKITLFAVGRMKRGPLLDLVSTYTQRSEWPITIKEIEGKPGLSGPSLVIDEGEKLLSALPDGITLLGLDEKGEQLSSTEFAKLIESLQVGGHSHLGFVIGGADGLSDGVRTRAHKLISFGRCTWPHMMVRPMLCEQLYRAQQILKGHPYHRE